MTTGRHVVGLASAAGDQRKPRNPTPVATPSGSARRRPAVKNAMLNVGERLMVSTDDFVDTE